MLPLHRLWACSGALCGSVYSFHLVSFSSPPSAGVLLCLKVYSWFIYGERCTPRPPTLPSCLQTDFEHSLCKHFHHWKKLKQKVCNELLNAYSHSCNYKLTSNFRISFPYFTSCNLSKKCMVVALNPPNLMKIASWVAELFLFFLFWKVKAFMLWLSSKEWLPCPGNRDHVSWEEELVHPIFKLWLC